MVEMPSINLSGVKVAPGMHIEQYFGVWAVEPGRFAQMLQHVADINLAAHVQLAGELQQAAPLSGALGAALDQDMGMEMTAEGVAILSLQGTLTKYGSSFSSQGSTQNARRMIRNAARSERAKAIVLRIDSPGGSVAGTDDLARDIADAAKQKPVIAYAEDLMASAAYWVGSQATKIYANPSAEIGSIGVYTYLHDVSRMAENAGVKAIVVRSGKFKGMGTPGEAVSDEMLAEVQSKVDEYAADFASAVAMGRKMKPDAVAEIADGRTFKAAAAQSMGLIDGVMSFDEAVAKALPSSTKVSAVNKRPAVNSTKGDMSMSTEEKTGSADSIAGSVLEAVRSATIQELRGACPGASSDFIVSQMEANATLEQAKTAFIAEQSKAIAAKEESAARVETAKTKSTAGLEITSAATPESTADDFESLVTAEMQSRGCKRHVAVRNVARKNPEARLNYVRNYNAEHGRVAKL